MIKYIYVSYIFYYIPAYSTKLKRDYTIKKTALPVKSFPTESNLKSST